MRALLLNCTLKPSPSASNTEALGRVVVDALSEHDVETEIVRVVDHDVHPGVSSDEGDGDEWPTIHEKLLAAEILIVATPTWLGRPSSVAQRVLERMDAMLSEEDDDGRPVAYNRVAGVVVTGNEDGAHHVISEISGGPDRHRLHDPRPGLDLLEPRPGPGRRVPRLRRGQGLVPLHGPGGGGQPGGDGPSAGGEPGGAAGELGPGPRPWSRGVLACAVPRYR